MMMAVMAMLKLMWCRALSGSWRMVRRQTAGRDANQRAFAKEHQRERQPPGCHVHGFVSGVVGKGMIQQRVTGEGCFLHTLERSMCM